MRGTSPVISIINRLQRQSVSGDGPPVPPDEDDGLWHDDAYFVSDDGLWHDAAYFPEDDGLWHDAAYF